MALDHKEEKRLQLIGEILGKKYLATQAFVQYLNTTREYTNGEDLYMREAHFVTSVQPGEGKTISEVAEILGVTHGAASQTATRLEKKGYILRRKSETDRRQTVVILTPMGEEFCRRHIQYDLEEWANLDREAFKGYSDEELALIRDYEALMYAHFTKTTS